MKMGMIGLGLAASERVEVHTRGRRAGCGGLEPNYVGEELGAPEKRRLIRSAGRVGRESATPIGAAR